MANVIAKLNRPALIISHNKTLAGQLYQELRDFSPQNAVSYFVSYYDYYQPEAYIPQTDTYIEKETDINEQIDKLRLQATTNILTRPDAIVVASVSCIYNLGSPIEYGRFILEIKRGEKADWNAYARRLVELQYERSEFEFTRGTFRIRGNHFDIYPAYEDIGYRIQDIRGRIGKIDKIEPISGKILTNQTTKQLNNQITKLIIYPAKHYLADPNVFTSVEKEIRRDLDKEYTQLKSVGKTSEAERLLRRVNYDLELIKEVGYVNGIENYSRYLDGRSPGDPPHTLLEYFQKAYGDDYLIFIDESHMTVPQVRGMYNGDQARKKVLIDFGFRLKAAFDNRPLKFEEFYNLAPQLIYTSATPDSWELEKAGSRGTVEQLVRPTGIVDPKITIRPAKDEVQDLISEIEKRAKVGQKILVTTLTKKTAEDLSEYLLDRGIRASYLHSDIKTLLRSDVLDNLRKGTFDVLIGVNLLREGLDLPEVTLVAILDADREGFLRSRTSLIQTMGRAARNVSGEVILYADNITGSMKGAISEIDRRRTHQLSYNKAHKITPRTVEKPIRGKIVVAEESLELIPSPSFDPSFLEKINPEALTPYDRKRIVKRLEHQMRKAAGELNFEIAIRLRDKVRELNQV